MSKRAPARYAVTFGLAGLYMPDCHDGAHECHSRRELVTLIRDLLASHDMPARLFREAGVKDLWRFITRHGSSSAHFALSRGDHELAFHGLTEAEFNAYRAQEDAA